MYEIVSINVGSSAAPCSRVDPCVCVREMIYIAIIYMR